MTVYQVYKILFNAYGPQHWWPADSPFEVMVGAILTQNTSWKNVEYAIANLKSNDCLTPAKILSTSQKDLAHWLRPSGYFNIKATRLKNYCQWYADASQYQELNRWDTPTLRKALLSVNGVGSETADDILLYAFDRPVFVIDMYTRRLFSRLKLISVEEEKRASYETLQLLVESQLKSNAVLYNEYHALIVQHAKQSCKKRPACETCCLSRHCPSSSQQR